MPERSSLTQGVQIGVETTPGTGVAANKLLNSLGFDLGVEVDMQRFRPQGQKFPSIITPGKEWSGIELTGVGTYSEIIYPLASVCNAVAGVQNGATTAYTWTFSPAARAEDTVKTYTIEVGGSVRAHKATYGLITDFNLSWTRDGVEITGGGIAKAISDGATLTGSPSAIEEKPILPTHLSVYADDTSGGLGTTKLTRALSGSFNIGNRFAPLWVVDAAQTSFAAHVEQEPSVQAVLMLEADAQGMGLLPTMRAGTTKFLRFEALHTDLAGTAFPYKVWIDVAAKVSSVARFSDEDGVFAIEWTFDSVYDATWGKAFQIAVTNKQVTL